MARRKRRAARKKAKTPTRLGLVVRDIYRLGQFFAALFIVFLVAAAVMLARGDEVDANQAAVYAYYSLVASVVLLIVATVLEERMDARRIKAGERAHAETRSP